MLRKNDTCPVSEVVGELYVARERESERLVEVEYFQQLVPLDHVQVAVSRCLQRSESGSQELGVSMSLVVTGR